MVAGSHSSLFHGQFVIQPERLDRTRVPSGAFMSSVRSWEKWKQKEMIYNELSVLVEVSENVLVSQAGFT